LKITCDTAKISLNARLTACLYHYRSRPGCAARKLLKKMDIRHPKVKGQLRKCKHSGLLIKCVTVNMLGGDKLVFIVFAATISFLCYTVASCLNKAENMGPKGIRFRASGRRSCQIGYVQWLWQFFRALFDTIYSKIFELFEIE